MLKHFKHLFANLLAPLLGISLLLEHIMIEFDQICNLTVISCTWVFRPHLPTFNWGERIDHLLLLFLGTTVQKFDWIDWCVKVWFDWLMCKCVVFNFNFFLFGFRKRIRTHDHSEKNFWHQKKQSRPPTQWQIGWCVLSVSTSAVRAVWQPRGPRLVFRSIS